MSDRELWCLVCLYVRPRPGISEDEAAEMDMLTVVNGQQVCLRHVDCAKGEGKHQTLKSGVWFESRGEIEGLSAYQEWRERQDDEPPVARMDRSASTGGGVTDGRP